MQADSPHAMAEFDQGAQVAAYLQAHPGFLAERPDLLHVLTPPKRVHGEVLADHMAAMVGAARAKAACVLAAGRASAMVAARVQQAVLALLGAAEVTECVTESWPGLLGVDAANLACEGEVARWTTLPAGEVARALGDQACCGRDRPGDAALWHREAALLARRDMLIRIPGPRPAILALASRDPAALPATQAWVFLGQVLGAVCQHG